MQAEILGCTLILSHLSASPLSAEILLGDLGSSLMQEGSVSPDSTQEVFPGALNSDQATELVCMGFKFQ